MEVRMVRVKHKSRRRGVGGDQGIILVGSVRYKLDENGEVDVQDEHAKAMLQGANWSEIVHAPAPQPPPTSVVTEPAAEEPAKEQMAEEGDVRLEDMARDDLVKRAEALGFKVDRRQSKLKIVQAIKYKAAQRGER